MRSAAAAAIDTVAQLIETFKFPTVTPQRAHQRSQVASRDTDNLSEKPTSEEVDETFRDVEVDGNGRIDSSGFRQDALAKIQEVTELGQSFVKNDT